MVIVVLMINWASVSIPKPRRAIRLSRHAGCVSDSARAARRKEQLNYDLLAFELDSALNLRNLSICYH